MTHEDVEFNTLMNKTSADSYPTNVSKEKQHSLKTAFYKKAAQVWIRFAIF